MAGFMGILGSLVQNGLSGSSSSRIANALGGDGGGLGDLMGNLSQMVGGDSSSGEGGGLGGMLGSVLGGSDEGQESGAGGLSGLLGKVTSNLSGNSAALGGLGALGGALLGGGGKAAKGAIGGGALALLASLGMAALKKSGQQPVQPPAVLNDNPTSDQEQEMDREAKILVKAMINAAKADGEIDEEEQQRIIGKLDDDGLSEEEKNFFQDEAAAPLDLEGVIASAEGRPEMGAQIYAASLLAIEVDTAEEKEYMQNLAEGLGLGSEVVSYIEESLKK